MPRKYKKKQTRQIKKRKQKRKTHKKKHNNRRKRLMKGGGVTGNFFRFLADAYETDDRKRKLELDEDYIKYKKMQMEKNIEEGEANEKLYQDEIKENEEEARRENSEIAIIDAEDSVENEEEDDSYNVLQENKKTQKTQKT